jgi:SAM-dependent methyltransferase
MSSGLRFDETVRRHLSPWIGRDIKVLEAGCGARSSVDFGDRAYVVGLDIDEAAVAKNERLDEALVGDLETYPLPAETFDVVVCRFVLEHLKDPERALANMRRTLKPGGWLTVMFPNRWSLKGIVARLTPHSLHVRGYRAVFRKASAKPYETRFERAVSTRGIRQFAEREGLRVVTLEPHPGDWDWLLLKHAPVLGRLLLLAERVVQLLTLGRVSAQQREFIAILADSRSESVASP